MAVEAHRDLGSSAESVKEGLVEAAEAAFALEEFGGVNELIDIVEGVPRGVVPQYLVAHVRRWRARLAQARGEQDRAEQGFKSAAGLFRELGVPLWLAVTLLEQGEWLAGQDRAEEAHPLLTEAGEIFERLKAKLWLERLERLTLVRTTTGSGSL
jgi:hypothetical protein